MQTGRLDLPNLIDNDGNYVRKCVEVVFRDTNIELEMWRTIRGRKPKAEKEPIKPHVDRLIIRSEGKTYAELLRAVKVTVNVSEATVTI